MPRARVSKPRGLSQNRQPTPNSRRSTRSRATSASTRSSPRRVCRSCSCPSLRNNQRRERNGPETCHTRRGCRSPPARATALRRQNACHRPHIELLSGAPHRACRCRDPLAQGSRPHHLPMHRGARTAHAFADSWDQSIAGKFVQDVEKPL